MSRSTVVGAGLGRGTVSSADRRYRYLLSVDVATSGGTVNFVLLNPSTADELHDDPTVRRCIGFARSWGAGRVVVTNLFGLKSTDPGALGRHEDPVGPRNDEYVMGAAKAAQLVVAAWGNGGLLSARSERVLGLLRGAGVEVRALRLTKLGEPAHVLYLPGGLGPAAL